MKIRVSGAVIAAFTASAVASCAGLYYALNKVFDGDVPVDLIDDIVIHQQLNADGMVRIIGLSQPDEETKALFESIGPYLVPLIGDREFDLKDPEQLMNDIEPMLVVAASFYALEEGIKALPLSVDDPNNPIGTGSATARVLLEVNERELRNRYIQLSGTPALQALAPILGETGPVDPDALLTQAIALKKAFLRIHKDGTVTAEEFLEFVRIRNSSWPDPSREAEAAAGILLGRVDLPSTPENIRTVAVQAEYPAEIMIKANRGDLLSEPEVEVTPDGPR